MRPFRGMLVEGTSGVGKSSLIDALIRRHVASAEPRRIRSLVHLAQSHTYGPLAAPEDHGTLAVEENVGLLDRIVSHVEWLHAGVQEHLRPWCFVVIDTLHFTHCVRPGVVGWRDVAAFDQRLAAVGFKLLCLEASPATIWKRGIDSRVNDQFILQYARKFGSSLEEIHEYFVKEQQILSELFSQSAMPKLVLHSEASAEDNLDAAFKFWTEDPE